MDSLRKILNREFRFVFMPKDLSKFPGKKYKRFGIGAGQLEKYLGSSNAAVVSKKALDLTDDKLLIKFRATGWVYIYSK